MSTLLITLDNIKEFKGISSNINTLKDLEPHILEAQMFDLRPFMGDSFYLALLEDFNASPSLVTYSNLFNGQEYTYNGYQYRHEGLKAILVYHAYARFISGDGVQSTPSGFVKKTTQYSEPIDPKTSNRLIQQARSGATAHEQLVEEYINRNASSFPLFRCNGNKSNFKTGMKIRKIG